MCPLVPCQLARAPSQRPGPHGGGMNEAFIRKREPRLAPPRLCRLGNRPEAGGSRLEPSSTDCPFSVTLRVAGGMSAPRSPGAWHGGPGDSSTSQAPSCGSHGACSALGHG